MIIGKVQAFVDKREQMLRDNDTDEEEEYHPVLVNVPTPLKHRRHFPGRCG